MGGKRLQIEGQKFGRLLALERVTNTDWLFRCDCGNVLTKKAAKVTFGHTKSCGCLHSEIVAERNRKNSKHGLYASATWYAWQSMKKRCLDSANKNYGGRGLTFCGSWNSFENFLKDMGEKPEGLSLDRINNNEGYSADNCRWTDSKTQTRNRRTTKTFNEVPLGKLAEELGINYEKIYKSFKKGTLLNLLTNQPRERNDQ